MLVVGENVEEGIAAEKVQDDADVVAAQEGVNAAIKDDVQEQYIPSPTPPPQLPQDLPSTSSVQSTPPPSPQPQPQAADFPLDLEISKLKKRVKRLKKGNKVKVLKLRRLKKVGTSQRIDTSDDTIMEDDKNSDGDDQVKGRQAEIYQINMDHPSKVLSMQEDEPAEVEEVVEVVTTAKLITEVVAAASKSVSAASTTILAAEPQVPAVTPTDVPVEIDEEYARKLLEELNQDIDWDVAIDHVKQKAKEDPYVQRYHVMKKRPQTEAQARRNKIMYLKNEQIEEEERRATESINETPAQKAAKMRKLNEEVAELNKHLEIVPDEDDDVFTEATPLARKHIVVATSSIEDEYVAAASSCAQVLWIQNQLLDYGKELASPKQTALGKDISNLFMAGSLPKTIWHFIIVVSYKLMLFGLMKVVAVNLMLLGEGFDQIIDFHNAHTIQYALVVNPTIYVSCIKKFWATATIKKFNDVVQLRAPIDGKKVVVSEDVIQRDIYLDDADGVECLSNEDIFVELAQMGYKKPPPKLTFYKVFFSA
nr:uncharacterized mitochondrial protein AtMg00810-like [Tanacetum cinerariifolium]